MLLPENVEEHPLEFEQIGMIRDSLENLRSYFCTDGQDIPIQFIDNKALVVTSMLQLCDQTTRQLIDLYHAQKDTHDKYLTQEHIKKIITMRALNSDTEASTFITESKQNIEEGKVSLK